MAGTKLTVEQIVAKKTALENRDSSRNSAYDEVLQFYAGDTYKNVKKKGFLPGITDGANAVLARISQVQYRGAHLQGVRLY